MRITVIISIVLLSMGCTSMTTTTGYSGINYGDSYKKVLKKLSREERVIEKSEDSIVAIGLWELTRDCRKMVFMFSEGQELQQVSFQPAPKDVVEDGCE